MKEAFDFLGKRERVCGQIFLLTQIIGSRVKEVSVKLNKSSSADLSGGVRLLENYEYSKQAWIASHTEATPEQYTSAMIEIARRCGV